MNLKLDPGEPLSCNMYTDYKNYPNLSKLPNDLEDSLDMLDNNKVLKEAFGDNVIESYIKLKKEELSNFAKEEIFDKNSPITNWEKQNTLDC